MEPVNNMRCLLLYVILMPISYYTVAAVKQSIGSCNFEVTDPQSGHNLCGYTYGPTDSNEYFDWTLEESNGEHYMSVKTELHEPGQKARLYSPEIRQQDTHCYSFQYHIEGGLSITSNASEPANTLNVYVLDKENGRYILPVWQSGLSTYQSGWTTVQLALNPRAYQVVFEANIAQSTPGVITLDNIIIDNKACVSAPHFLRMGDKEANEGQDITLNCLLWGHNFTHRERITNETVLLQKFTGDVFPPTNEEIYDDHLSVEFTFPTAVSNHKGQYRCISQTATSAGVSNFVSVEVKVPPVPQRPPDIKDVGSTYLNISLNGESYVGDAPIIKTVLNYRPLSDGLWSDSHEISSPVYHLWHLKPDTSYQLRVTLTRPGKGGRGKPGPVLTARTSCGAPRKPVSDVQIQAIASTELKVMWQSPDFSVVQCHYHSYIIKYRKYIPSNSSSAESDFDEVSAEKGDTFVLLYQLEPYTLYEVKIVLDNSQGSIETRSLLSRTGEGVPEPIPQDSFIVTFSNETAISLQWDDPKVTHGVIVGYEMTYRGSSTYHPDFIPQLDSGFFTVNKNNITITNLHAGTTYRFSVRPRTGGGGGRPVETVGQTKIAAPKMAEYPPPEPDNGTSSTATTIKVNILPAEANGGPISSYYIVIEEVGNSGELQGDDSSKSNKHKNGSGSGRKRKRNRKRQKRQTTDRDRVRRQTEINTKDTDSPCYSDPITYEDAKKQNKSFYFGGKLTPEDVSEGFTFVVGEGRSSGGFNNPPLDPNKKYNVYIRVDSNVKNDTKVNCALVAIKASAPPTTTAPPPATTQAIVAPVEATTKDATNVVLPPDDIADGSENPTVNDAGQTENDNLVLYAGVGASVFFVLLLIVIIIIIVKNRKGRMRPKDEVVNPFEVRMMMSDMIGTANTHSMTRSFGSPDRQALMMPDVVDFENHDFMEKTMDASGTRVSSTFRSASTPMVEDRPVLRVDDFHIHVNDMKRQNNFGFHDEFSSFREGKTAAWDVGKKEQNRNKNRYGNIMAYDHSRVILQAVKGQDELESDYINANYILGYKSPSMYIAAQAPSAETMNDFWLMIWQESTPVIVMVTNLVELGKRKCHKYWPDDTDQFGAIKVSLTDTEELSDYTIRTFIIQLEDGYDVREVKQFHFTAWPDHGVPEHPTSILSFIRRVKSHEPPGEGSTVVHCSAGCGRTGCFIVIDMMLDMAREEGVIDIYNTVNDLRNRRVNMVQTEEQYIFIHHAVLEVLLCGETLVAAQDLRQHYDDLITVDEQTQIAPVQEEFETLDVMTPKLTEEECAVAKLPRNRQRNRFMDVLPPDRKMPYLVTPNPNDPDSNYINAIFADSYIKRDAFIITQMPLPNTVIDFWRLIYDYNCSSIVMMNDATEHDQTCAVYWPDSSSANFGPFNVEVVQKEDEVDVVTRIFKVQNIRKPNEGYRLVQQFQLTNWPAAQPVPYTRNAVLRVIQLVTKWQNEHSNDGRVLIHCVAGAGRSGTFAACYNLCIQLRREGVVDVFNIVQRLRNVRPQLVETLEQYRFCYEVGWDFADQ